MEHLRLLQPLGMARRFVLQELGIDEGALPSSSGIPIASLGLPSRVVNSLQRSGILTLQELTRFSREELMERISGLGEQSVSLLEAKLREHGLWFREDSEE
jgi:DNA-directed RNA polymerase alpha subunit